MEFTLAMMEYLEQMCEITEQAKAQIRRMGFDQWQKGNPSREGWIQHNVVAPTLHCQPNCRKRIWSDYPSLRKGTILQKSELSLMLK